MVKVIARRLHTMFFLISFAKSFEKLALKTKFLLVFFVRKFVWFENIA